MTKTLWTKDFIRITLATSLGAAGGIISGFALSFLVFDETGSTLASALVVAIQLLPGAVLPLLIAPLMDRYPRKPFLVGGDTVEELHKLGWTYEKEGALWLKTAEIMREQYRKQGKKDEDIDKLDLKDDVLRRANGFYTYFAGDIAYHRNKFAVRHFDKVINIWGADHHGHVARMKGAMDALGLDGTNRLDIVLMQLVKLVRDGEVVRMSKRTGKTISLSDLLDEIPVDACRYFFNAKPDTQMEFDLGLAVREDSENPIYYIQYAHARICSLLKALEEEGHSVKSGAVDLSILSSESERALIKELSSFAEEIRMAARDYDPSYINRYLMRLAAAFHKFYNACRIKGEDDAVIDARLKLAAATRQVLANGLQVIGCSAPEKM